jgi:hypothetical protein
LIALLFSIGVLYPINEELLDGDSNESRVIRRVNIELISLIAILILFIIISANLLLYLPYLNDGSIWPEIFYWIGVIITPITFLSVIILYHKIKKEKYRRIDDAIGLGIALSPIIPISLLGYLPQITSNSDLYAGIVWTTTIFSGVSTAFYALLSAIQFGKYLKVFFGVLGIVMAILLIISMYNLLGILHIFVIHIIE